MTILKKKILFITNSYPDKIEPHRGHFVRFQAIELSKDFDTIILTPKIYNKTPFFEIDENIPIYRFPFFSGNKKLIEYKKIPFFKMSIYFLSGFILGFFLMIKNRFHLIHAHWVVPTGIIGIFLGMIFRCPVILHARGTDITYLFKNRFFKKLGKFLFNRAERIISVSDNQKKLIVDSFFIPDEKISVIPNGVDTYLFSPKEKNFVRKDLKLQMESFIILFIGGLIPVKGLFNLVKAACILKEYKDKLYFIIIGEGEEKSKLIKIANDLEVLDFFFFAGQKAHEEIPLWMNASDLFVLPSLSEGLPNVVLEALSTGLPVIASNVGGINEVITEEVNGLLFKPGDPEDLAKAILRVVKNPSLFNNMKKNARESIKKLDSMKQIDKIRDLYRRCFN
ncbi:MAG: glycosyltransferase [Deltaproteobacteria bacterium]|nr:glycosyltransferase [Deltaproteobacteria bacterium]